MRRPRNGLPLPGPYQSRENLPVGFTDVQFALLRDHLYPVYPDIVQQAIADGSFHPYAFLPIKRGPFSFPMGAMQAVFEAQAQLRLVQSMAVSTGGSRDTRGYQPRQPIRHPSIPLPVPGYGVKDMPFNTSVDIPGGERVKALLRSHPEYLSEAPVGTTMRVRAQQVPESLSQALGRKWRPR